MIDAVENGGDPSEFFADPIKKNKKKMETGNAPSRLKTAQNTTSTATK